MLLGQQQFTFQFLLLLFECLGRACALLRQGLFEATALPVNELVEGLSAVACGKVYLLCAQRLHLVLQSLLVAFELGDFLDLHACGCVRN